MVLERLSQWVSRLMVPAAAAASRHQTSQIPFCTRTPSRGQAPGLVVVRLPLNRELEITQASMAHVITYM